MKNAEGQSCSGSSLGSFWPWHDAAYVVVPQFKQSNVQNLSSDQNKCEKLFSQTVQLTENLLKLLGF